MSRFFWLAGLVVVLSWYIPITPPISPIQAIRFNPLRFASVRFIRGLATAGAPKNNPASVFFFRVAG
ncbi:hypothetical protein AH865_09510 [Salmonella enterica subsp. enterica serovar Infantis]|nr:hypothetical protein [Salmonella enterica subsp. enterica serovar Infantis]EGI5075530.1 hypothetical protein [Salmonella enterica subsp. enterica serovar Infantis]